MAYNKNKRSGKGDTIRMSLHLVLFCFCYHFAFVETSVFSLNNKYSSAPNMHFVEMKKDYADLLGIHSTRRFKRSGDSQGGGRPSASNSASSASIIADRVELSGTEDSNTAIIQWMDDNQHIIVLTLRSDVTDRSWIKSSQVWWSHDYGSSFERKKFDQGVKISVFYTFPSNKKKLLLTDIVAKTLYITENDLVNFTVQKAPVEPDTILVHPTDENKLLLYSISQQKLYVSTNNGANFTLVAEDVLQRFYWGDPLHDASPDTVHMEIEGEKPDQAVYISCTIPDCSDAKQQHHGSIQANTLHVFKEYIFIGKNSLDGSENYLEVSYKRNPFKRALFPGDLKADEYVLLNLDDDQVFLGVNHGDHVSLYLSEATGQYFVLSIADVVYKLRPGYFELDYHEVQGANWTFIVNKVDDGVEKTYISFDKGGNWAPLMVNKSCSVVEKCSLLLQVQHAGLRSMLSEENAPGIILAHGSIGLDRSTQETAVFTSRDGGGNWMKATLSDGTPLTGFFQFNILDQGSILSATPFALSTEQVNKTLFYSVDQGLHWTKYQFDGEGVVVKGVLTEPGSMTMVESLFGQEEGKDKPWTLIKLNFTNVLPRQCADQDYDLNWHLRDFNNVNYNTTTCVLGQSVSYKRRKSDAQCYNGDKFVHTVENTTCNCGPEDYECDFGYEESGRDNCVKAKWFGDDYLPSECDNGGTYVKSKGYRKIPADGCSETESDKKKYDGVATNCSSFAPAQLSILTTTRNIKAGLEVTFQLEQTRGSKFDTTYTWDFGDGTKSVDIVGFTNASVQKHSFHLSGHYNVSVKAKNIKGQATTLEKVHVQEPIKNLHVIGPIGGKVGVEMKFTIIVGSSAKQLDTDSDHIHFVWSFGNEKAKVLPTLTWENNLSHVYEKAGTYQLYVEAVNSVSSLYEEMTVHIYDDTKILVLTFNYSFVINKDPQISEYFTLIVKQQLALELGISMARLECVVMSADPPVAHLYIFPPSDPLEASVDSIAKQLMDEVKDKEVGVNIYGRYSSEEKGVIRLLSVTELSGSGGGGPNMKAVYIAAPLLVLAVIVSVVSFLYCRKKMRNMRQYNMLHVQDDSDALLDDDEAPLDLNIDFGVRDSVRDDPILDGGGSHLVMVTGGGASADNAENC